MSASINTLISVRTRPATATFAQSDQGQGAEVLLFQQWIGGTGGGGGVVEQRFDHAAQAGVEGQAGFRVELAAQAPHPGLAIHPGPQARVSSLLL